MNMDHRSVGNACIVRVYGNITLSGVPAIQKYLDPLLDVPEYQIYILNIDEVVILDSHGIGWIFGLYTKLRFRRKVLAICEPEKKILDAMLFAAVNKLVGIFHTQDQALDHFNL